MANDLFPYDFGLRLRQLREARHMTRPELAQKIDVTKETIYRYENNLQVPSLDKVRRIALVLNTTMDYLAGLEDSESISVHGLSEEQRSVLSAFIKTFVQKDA